MKKIKILNTAAALFFLMSTPFAQSVWLENSFEDFRDGSFLDAGSNAYVSAKGRIQMITRWDFNNDGNLDILLAAGHGHTEKENTFIYLNNGQDIDARSRIELPAAGSYDGLIEDLNKDGFNDIAVVHHSDSHVRRVPVWIYFGSDKGFLVENRIELPSYQGTAIVSGDFNNDSLIDIAVGCQFFEEGEDEETVEKRSFIYWNSEDGFKPENRLSLLFNGKGAEALTSGDVDNDGTEDLIATVDGKIFLLLSSKNTFINFDNAFEVGVKGRRLAVGDFNNDSNIDIAAGSGGQVLILKGNGTGKFDIDNLIKLSVSSPRDLAFTDVNQDGLEDLVVANFSELHGVTWTNSYVFFSDGKDFSSQKPLELPTMGASSVSCDDLNGDGYPEIVFSCEKVLSQNNLYSYVYWNDKGTYHFENHTQLPTLGSNSNTIGDVNNDGLPDVVFFNDEGYFRDGPSKSHIYWGDGTRNFSTLRSTEFLTHQVFGLGHADLDDDDNVDIIFSRQNFIDGIKHEQSGLTIHWGDDVAFRTITPLTMSYGYGGVRIADINKDGYLDILAGGRCIDLNDPEKFGFPIFWGSDLGYSFKNRTVLHFTIQRIRGQLLMDLNKDGWLDISGQLEDGKIRIWWGSVEGFNDDNFTDIDLERNDHLMYIKAADFNKDGWLDLVLPQRGNPDGREMSSFIYFGSPDGFSNDNRSEVASYVPYQNSIADLNNDGWLDLLLTSYGGEVSGNRPGLIYWGSENGFLEERSEIENYGGSGSETLDYDGDGWLDIVIANHRKSGSYVLPEPHKHTTYSMLYWGSENGYSNDNRWEVLAGGPSGLNLRDAGNSYDRGLYEDYYSSIYKTPDGESPELIEWIAEKPFGTNIHFQIRSADTKEDIEAAIWNGPLGKDSWFTKSGSKFKDFKGKFIQYRARLITPNGAATPYLTSVKIIFK
ncbi:FG-GAP repeat domain-containing protein [Bacteroidota bacterium]